jgi:hypothetical protein
MSALFMGDRASLVVLGFSPWIIPVIAAALKLTCDQTRRAFRGEFPQSPPSDQEHEREAPPLSPDVSHAGAGAQAWEDDVRHLPGARARN